jgi:sulfane dehydrogenase subunit SoxC
MAQESAHALHAFIPGRIQKAPEHHMDAGFHAKARTARRSFMGKALAMGAGVAATHANAASAEGEDAILKLPPHTVGLGQPVAARGYGVPSQYERNLQRRESPGLTRVGAASVSFSPTLSVTIRAGGISIPNSIV